MPDIQQLPASVINKIAAGEVIERPASVVKEVVENSIDAGSKRIEVAIEKGGQDLIRVSDDGSGIPADQLELAVTSHATSKIADADDLFQVGTLGFRGEALASISEVSQFVLRSRTSDELSGFELEVNGGERAAIAPCGCPRGTTLEVRNLFFNTPVRRKFLKTAQTEMGHITEAFTRVALAHPEIHFTLKHNDRVLHDLVPTESWQERIGHFFGPEIRDSLISIQADDGELKLWGYVADPSQSRANNKMQYLFLNGRHIKDRALQHALSEAYRGLMMTGRYPLAFLKMEMPLAWVDVNVHPAKLEVRFQDSGRVYSQLLGSIRTRFLSTDLTARARLDSPNSSSSTAPHTRPSETTPQTTPARQGVLEWLGETGSRPPLPSPARPPQDFTPSDLPSFSATTDAATPDAASTRQHHSPFDNLPAPPALSPHNTSSEPGNLDRLPSQPNTTSPHQPTTRRITALQIHNRYLVTENEDGMVVIDQHALHERVLYEQIRERALQGNMETQRLLVPETVTLSSAEAATAADHQEVLAQIGLEIEPFGGNTVLIHGYPAMMASSSPAEMLRAVVNQIIEGGKQPQRRDLLDELLHMMSCKAAIKAGDPLSPEEIDALIQHRDYCQDAHHCPHGRPTALVFSRNELDRRFKRI